MVTIGIMVEGATERLVLKSVAFQETLRKMRLAIAGDVIDVRGRMNLLSEKTDGFRQLLQQNGAEKLVILTDKEDVNCYSSLKAQINTPVDLIAIANRTIESWFLADSETLSALFQTNFFCEFPESVVSPIDTLKGYRQQFRGVGIGDKKAFARIMLNNGFTVEQAARHPNCPSARYFLTKLQTLASAN